MFYSVFDPTMIIVIPGLLAAIYAQLKVQSTFARFSAVNAARGLTGAEAARDILHRQGLDHVQVEMIEGRLSDNYDPRDKVLHLSPEVYRGTSLASLGVAAHETGHAIQHAAGYLPLNIRHSLVPIASVSSTAAFPLFLIGLLLTNPVLMKTGIYLFSAVLLFQIVTLPVEFNASRRALVLLEGNGYITNREEVDGVRSVLSAAALTYVAAALVSLLNLLRLLLISGLLGRRDD